MKKQTPLAEFAVECHASVRKLQLDVKAGLLEITRVGRTPFVTPEQKALYFIRKREATKGRTYGEQRELEKQGFGGGES